MNAIRLRIEKLLGEMHGVAPNGTLTTAASSYYDPPDPQFAAYFRAQIQTHLKDLADYSNRLDDFYEKHLTAAVDEDETKELKKLKATLSKIDKARQVVQDMEVGLVDLAAEIDKKLKYA